MLTRPMQHVETDTESGNGVDIGMGMWEGKGKGGWRIDLLRDAGKGFLSEGVRSLLA